MQPQKEKVRMFALARDLNMESKDLLALCQQHGLDIKNQLSTVEPEVQEQIRKLVAKPAGKPAAPAPAPTPAAPPQPTRPMKNLDTRPRPSALRPVEAPPPAEVPAPAEVVHAAAVAVAPAPAPVSEVTLEAPAPKPEPITSPVQAALTPPTPTAPPDAPAPTPTAAAAQRPLPPAARPLPNLNRPAMRNLNAPSPPRPSTPPPAAAPPIAPPPAPTQQPPRPAAQPTPPAPPVRPAAGPQQAPPAAPRPGQPTPQGPPRAIPPRPIGGHPIRPVQTGATPPGRGGLHRTTQPQRPGQPQPQGAGGPPRPGAPTQGPRSAGPTAGSGSAQGTNAPRKIGDIPPELMPGREAGSISYRDLEKKIEQHSRGPAVPGTPAPPVVGETDVGDDDEPRGHRKGSGGGGGGGGGGAPATAGGVAGRADRHKERAERQAKRQTGNDGRRISTLDPDDENVRYRSRRHREKPKPQGTVARKGRIPVTLPITIRSLSEAMGQKATALITKLMSSGAGLFTINSAIEPDMAELMALEFGCELEIKRSADVEQDVIDLHEQEDAPEDLVPRAPVVVVMGHVDHGKTSILDRIKGDNIVATEAGGITQVLRAWRIMHNDQPITFLDTPGHQAFTKMRARGANVTDIAVIVVAANDGVMPQTEEAISHAKAAEVAIVVAINKVDLPDANLRKTQQQLYSLGLVPDDMGGDVPFVLCSAKTGAGIDDLLEQIVVVAELLELKANPNKAASGTCLEAYLSEQEGVQATLLVQGGTLQPGDVVLCGHAAGTVRQLFNDRGQPIEEAGPSVPVRILGLDAVPNADDPFVVVEDIATAREIAESRKERIRVRAVESRVPVTLDTLKQAKVTELKVILKAEARGSIEAIRAELEKLVHDEVRVRVLHTGIGGINSSDVQLALTSPTDTIIVGFNVVADNEAKALADERGIQIRDYQIIYQLVDDIRSALEGKLKPKEEVIQLGRAIVRDTFRISKVGTIAGCFVTQGVIERSAKVRVIRGGVVIYPPAERTASLESLKRFKDDAREVREGFECGLKIAGYDDVKVDDIIECYRIEQVQRTLD